MLRFLAFKLMLAAVCATAAAAQTRPRTTAPAAPTTAPTAPRTAATGQPKIVLINPVVFADAKQGIKKYLNGVASVNAEFKTSAAEVDALASRVGAMQNELRTFNNKPATPQIKARMEEYDKLAREYKFKREDAEARYNRRRDAVLRPIRQEIGNAIQEYAKKNDYIVLDASKLLEAGVLLGYDEIIDITKDFITFYNSRTATTAAATAPK